MVGGVGHGLTDEKRHGVGPGSPERGVVDGAFVVAIGADASEVVDVGAERGVVDFEEVLRGGRRDDGVGVDGAVVRAVGDLVEAVEAVGVPNEGRGAGEEPGEGETVHGWAGEGVGVRDGEDGVNRKERGTHETSTGKDNVVAVYSQKKIVPTMVMMKA